MAKTIVNFMAVHSDSANFASVNISNATAELQDVVASTGQLLAPYLKAFDALDPLCPNMQRTAFALDNGAWERVKFDVKYYPSLINEPAFILDKTSVKKGDDGSVTLHLPVFTDYAPNITDVSDNNYLSPRSVFCKMRTQEAFVAESGLSSSVAFKNCAQLNQLVIQQTLSTLTDDQQKARLEQRYGALESWTVTSTPGDKADAVTYGPFVINSTKKATGQDFIGGTFSFAPEKARTEIWALETPQLQTPKNLPVQAFAGAYYCKLIAPARVIEWATLFGLK